MISKDRRASRRSCRACRNWAGPMAATCGSIFAGVPAMPVAIGAAELVELAPDVILASGGSIVGPLLQATSTVPVVFTQTPDPVGAGFVESLARPGGNATGFSIFDYSLGGKWLELLKQIAPGVTRVAVIRDPATPQGIGQFSALHSLAPSLGLEVTPVNARGAGDLERALAAVERNPTSGLIVTGS